MIQIQPQTFISEASTKYQKMPKSLYMLLPLITYPILLIMVTGTDAVSCSDAVNAMIPCGSYLIGAGGNDPSAECCSSAQALNKMATSVQSKRQLCQCLKSTGPSFGVQPKFAARLVQVCRLNLRIPVSPNVNCNIISTSGFKETP